MESSFLTSVLPVFSCMIFHRDLKFLILIRKMRTFPHPVWKCDKSDYLQSSFWNSTSLWIFTIAGNRNTFLLKMRNPMFSMNTFREDSLTRLNVYGRAFHLILWIVLLARGVLTSHLIIFSLCLNFMPSPGEVIDGYVWLYLTIL